MILGPVMLELGLHPMVVASTSLLLVGASSSTATVQFALGDRLEYGWGIIMFGVCVVASLVGVAGFGRVVRSSGRASLIVFLLFFLMAAGGIMTLVSFPQLSGVTFHSCVALILYRTCCKLCCKGKSFTGHVWSLPKKERFLNTKMLLIPPDCTQYANSEMECSYMLIQQFNCKGKYPLVILA